MLQYACKYDCVHSLTYMRSQLGMTVYCVCYECHMCLSSSGWIIGQACDLSD